MEKRDFVVDLGNGAVKFRLANGELAVFKATTMLNDIQYDLTGRHEITLYDRENNNSIYYVIGDDEGDYCANERRYLKEEYQSLLLTAIGVAFHSLDENEFEINLGINLPLEVYKKGQAEKILKSRYENKTFEFKVDKKEYKIKITSVTALPENLVAELLNKDEIKYKNLFFDLGNGTADILFTEGLRLGKMKTVYKGTDKLIEKICKKANTRANQIRKYWEDLSQINVKGIEKNLNKIKEESILEYTSDLIGIAEDMNGGNLNDVRKVYLLGGGALVINDDVKMIIENDVKMFDNPQFANLLCLEKMFRKLKQSRK